MASTRSRKGSYAEQVCREGEAVLHVNMHLTLVSSTWDMVHNWHEGGCHVRVNFGTETLGHYYCGTECDSLGKVMLCHTCETLRDNYIQHSRSGSANGGRG